MSYYMRLEAVSGELLVGMEIEHDGGDGRFDDYIELYCLNPGDKIKLYDLANPTRTIKVEEPNGNISSDGADGTEPGDVTNGSVQSDE